MKSIWSFIVYVIGIIKTIFSIGVASDMYELYKADLVGKTTFFESIVAIIFDVTLVFCIGLALNRCEDLEDEVGAQISANQSLKNKVSDLEYDVQDIKVKMKKIDIEKES